MAPATAIAGGRITVDAVAVGQNVVDQPPVDLLITLAVAATKAASTGQRGSLLSRSAAIVDVLRAEWVAERGEGRVETEASGQRAHRAQRVLPRGVGSEKS